jgi:hypothetical protein
MSVDNPAGATLPIWLGSQMNNAAVDAPDSPRGEVWVGQHSVDADILVYDPAGQPSSSDLLAYFSMTQLRTRTFPRAVAARTIAELTDEVQAAQVKRDYQLRAQLSATREAELAAARASSLKLQKEEAVQRHERYLASLEIPYKGVRSTPSDHRKSRRTKCGSCGIGLDDYAGSLCNVCSESLCSCGACACKRPKEI